MILMYGNAPVAKIHRKRATHSPHTHARSHRVDLAPGRGALGASLTGTRGGSCMAAVAAAFVWMHVCGRFASGGIIVVAIVVVVVVVVVAVVLSALRERLARAELEYRDSHALSQSDRG